MRYQFGHFQKQKSMEVEEQASMARSHLKEIISCKSQGKQQCTSAPSMIHHNQYRNKVARRFGFSKCSPEYRWQEHQKVVSSNSQHKKSNDHITTKKMTCRMWCILFTLRQCKGSMFLVHIPLPVTNMRIHGSYLFIRNFTAIGFETKLNIENWYDWVSTPA